MTKTIIAESYNSANTVGDCLRLRCKENKHRHENNNMNVCLKFVLIRE